MDTKTVTRVVDGIEVPGPGTWKLDPAHTQVTITARHLMVMKVRGHFSDVSGTVHIAEKLEDSWAEVVIGAASIDTGVEDRDNHLRSADFLDVERFPEIRFKSTSLQFQEGTKFRHTGDLTIRDVTRPIVLDAELEGVVAKDPWGKTRAAYSAHGVIDREEWGMTWNVALETGGWLVSKDMSVDLEIETVFTPDESQTAPIS
jgi:polyisoprenoid-binding protein YceI